MPNFDVDAALADGHSIDEIAQFLSTENGFDYAKAKNDGVNDAQIVNFLATAQANRNESIAGDLGTALSIGTTVDIPQQVIGVGRALAKGLLAAGGVEGVGGNEDGVSAAGLVGKAVFDPASETVDTRRKRLEREYTPETQAANSAEWSKFNDEFAQGNDSVNTPESFTPGFVGGDAVSSPGVALRKGLIGAVESLPGTVATMGPTAMISRKAAVSAMGKVAALTADQAIIEKAGQAAAERAAMLAGGLSEGVQGGGQQFEDTYGQIKQTPIDDKLRANPEFVEALKQTDPSLPKEQREQSALEILATEGAIISGAGAFAFDSVLGGLGDRYIGSASVGKGKRIGSALEGFTQESATEFGQSVGEQVSENLAKRQTVNPEQNLLEGTGEQGISGALSGGLMGFAMGGGFHRGMAELGKAESVDDAIKAASSAVEAAPRDFTEQEKQRNLATYAQRLVDLEEGRVAPEDQGEIDFLRTWVGDHDALAERYGLSPIGQGWLAGAQYDESESDWLVQRNKSLAYNQAKNDPEKKARLAAEVARLRSVDNVNAAKNAEMQRLVDEYQNQGMGWMHTEQAEDKSQPFTMRNPEDVYSPYSPELSEWAKRKGLPAPERGFTLKNPEDVYSKFSPELSTQVKNGGALALPQAWIHSGKPSESILPDALEQKLSLLERQMDGGVAGQRFQKDDGSWDGFKSTNPEWLKSGPLHSVGKDVIATVISKARRGKKLTDNQRSIWAEIKKTADREWENDPDTSAAREAERIQDETGIELHEPRALTVGELEKGDKAVVVGTNGLPDVVTHKGYDEDGNAILKDGITIHADPFDTVKTIGVQHNYDKGRKEFPATDVTPSTVKGKETARQYLDRKKAEKELRKSSANSTATTAPDVRGFIRESGSKSIQEPIRQGKGQAQNQRVGDAKPILDAEAPSENANIQDFLTDGRSEQKPSTSNQDENNGEERKGQRRQGLLSEGGELSVMGQHFSLRKELEEGSASVEDYRAGFERLVAGKDEVVAELSKKTKTDLLSGISPFFARRYKNEKKEEVVRAIYNDMLSFFTLGESYSYGMGEGSRTRSIRAIVEKTTESDIAEYAKQYEAAMAKQKERLAQIAEAVKDPKTLQDFIDYLRSMMADGASFADARMTLSVEQRAKFDELTAEKSRGERKARADQQKTAVRSTAVQTTGEIIETKHTKTGEDLFVVRAGERVEREVYNEWNTTAKRMGGYYSSYRGGGAVPGFQFKTRENAEAFAAFLGGNTDQAQAVIKERRSVYEDDKSQSAVERLNTMADALEERADVELSRARASNTARRARIAASAEAAAESNKALAKTMRNIASGIENGEVKFLDRVRQKVQVEMLRSFVNSAQYRKLAAKYPDYSIQEKHKGDRPDAETADFAEFPAYQAFRSDLARLGRQLQETEGTKKIGTALLKVADDVTDAYLKFAKENTGKVAVYSLKGGGVASFATKREAEIAIEKSGYRGKAIVFQLKRNQNLIILSPQAAKEAGVWKGDDDKRIALSKEFGSELVEKAERKKVDVPWYFDTVMEQQSRLEKMGIETPAEFRAALREFIGLQAAPAQADKVKELERQMIGRANDGLDFFPTPASVAQTMVDVAEIKEGMSVLEPSAGMGHIAEVIRKAGVDPDVLEMSSIRRELLEAKGFNVVGQDFMDMTPRGFTFGDVYRAPDGTEGVMRGLGGLGSNRVRLVVDGNERMATYHNREDLEPIRKNGLESGYDRIIMNPPFSKRRDVEHVRHAYDMLRPGGRLVAIMGEGSFFGSDKAATEFREWLESVGGTSEKLEDGTFQDKSLQVNTGVNARMVVIEKSVDAKYSRAEAPTTSTTDTVKSEISTKLGRFRTMQLMRKGVLNIVGSQEEAKRIIGEARAKLSATLPDPSKGWYRFNKNERSPMSDWNHAMFVEGDMYQVEHYGNVGWEVDASVFPGAQELRGKIEAALLEDVANENTEYEPVRQIIDGDADVDDVIDQYFPEDIVNSAQAYDNEEYFMWFWDRVAEPNDIRGVKTPDGAIAFYEEDISRFAVKYSKSGAIQGFALNGKTYLVSDGIQSGEGWQVFLHEITHLTRLGIKETAAWRHLLVTINRQIGRDSALGRALSEAETRIPKDTNPDDKAEELLAYLVENDKTDISLVRRFIAMVKSALVKMGISPTIFSVHDFKALAVNAAKWKGTLVSGGNVMQSVRGANGSGQPDVQQAQSYRLDEGTKAQQAFDYLVYKAQDRFSPLKKMEGAAAKAKGLESLPENQSAYDKEIVWSGRAQAINEEFIEQHVDPLIKFMHDNGLTWEDADKYLWARHAPEANAHLEKINPDRDNNKALSGMFSTEKDKAAALKQYPGDESIKDMPVAETVMDEFKQAGKLKALDEVGKRVDEMTKMRRDLIRSSGREKAETIDAWEKAYKHYVPLHRDLGEDGNSMPAKGKGFDGAGKEKRRAGSTKEAVNILARVVAQYESTVIRTEKDKVGHAFLNFVRNNPNPDLYEVDRVKYTPRFGKDGLVTYAPEPGFMHADNVFTVRVNGDDIRVTFNKNNVYAARLAKQMKNLGVNDLGWTRYLLWINRFLSSANTSYSPEFVISNLARDLQTALYNINGTEAEGLKGAIFKDVAKAWRGIRRAQSGDYSSEYAKAWREFKLAGAKTGWLEGYSNIQAREDKLKSQLEAMSGGAVNSIKKGLLGVVDFVENENTAIENATRLATFVNLRKRGVAIGKSAKVAKELTVNFNRRGDAGQALNALYLFFNASVQGSARLLTAAKNKKVQAMMASTVAFAFALDLLNRSMSGDDDDGRKYYDKIKDREKDRNLIVMLKGKRYIKIPLPWGYNVFHVMGQEFAKMADPRLKKYKPDEGAMRIASNLLGAFNPLGSESSIAQMLSPTITDPIIQVAENKDWSGAPLRPDASFDKYKPDSQRYWNSVREPSRLVAEKLNEMTGGSKARPGYVDISPETIDLVVDMITGSAGKFLADTVATPYKSVSGKDTEVKEWPLVRKVVGDLGNEYSKEEFYNNTKAVKITENELDAFSSSPDKKQSIRKDRHGEVRLIGASNSAQLKVAELRKKKRQIEERDKDDPRIKQIDERIEREMKKFNRLYYEANP